MFKLNYRYQMTAPQGTITQTGVSAIYQLMYAQDLTTDDWAALNPAWNVSKYLPGLPDDWDWRWSVSTGDYRGKFPKRLSQYYYKAFGLKAPEGFLVQVGNIARAHSEDRSAYYFDFTDSFDWHAGDFGDDGSCFWGGGGNSYARVMLRDNGARAIRFYSSADPAAAGVARAWIAPLEAEGLYIVFNGYGFPGYATLAIARVFAQFMERSYRRLNLVNIGDTSGTLWINSGMGYVVGHSAAIAEMDFYDLHWPEDDEDDGQAAAGAK